MMNKNLLSVQIFRKEARKNIIPYLDKEQKLTS